MWFSSKTKVVETLLPVHQAQLITNLKLTGLSLGILINWNVPVLRDGIKRVVLNHPSRPLSLSHRSLESFASSRYVLQIWSM